MQVASHPLNDQRHWRRRLLFVDGFGGDNEGNYEVKVTPGACGEQPCWLGGGNLGTRRAIYVLAGTHVGGTPTGSARGETLHSFRTHRRGLRTIGPAVAVPDGEPANLEELSEIETRR